MTDYQSCGYTVQTELINQWIICVSSGGLSHIPNELIHSASPGEAPMYKQLGNQHMTRVVYVSYRLPLLGNECATLEMLNEEI